jgi:RNA polymerase sigma factor (sigma-70 family)
MDPDATRVLKASPKSPALWEAFYRAMYPTVLQAAFRLCGGNADVARDAAQEAFVRFAEHKSIVRVENDAHAAAFLRQIARRSLFDRLRQERGKGQFEQVESSHLHVDAATSAWIAEEARIERLHDLETLAKSLSAEDQHLLGRLLDGDSLEELAKNQGVSYSALAVRVHRMRRRLAKAFEDQP